MIKALGLLTAAMVFATSSAFATSNFFGGVKVARMWVDNQGIFVGFSSKPDDCAGSFWGIHGKISSSTPNFNQIMALLLSAKATGESVDIWYGSPSSQLSCQDPNFLLPIYGVGFSG